MMKASAQAWACQLPLGKQARLNIGSLATRPVVAIVMLALEYPIMNNYIRQEAFLDMVIAMVIPIISNYQASPVAGIILIAKQIYAIVNQHIALLPI